MHKAAKKPEKINAMTPLAISEKEK
jgi:hypothetical protein